MAKKKILFVCDEKGWLQYYKATQLKNHLDEFFKVGIACVSTDNIKDFDDFDLYITFDVKTFGNLGTINKKKKVLGISNPTIVPPDGCKFIHTNDISAYKKFKKDNSIFYLPNGVDSDTLKFSKIPVDRKLIIGSVNILSPGHKNIKTIASKTGCRYITKNLNRKNFLPVSYHFNFYKSIDVLLADSTNPLNIISITEALSCGRPVVTSIPNDIVKNGHNGYNVYDNVEESVDILKKLKNDRPQILKMGKNARKSVEDGLTWRIQADKYKGMIFSILGIKEKKKEKQRNSGVATLKDRPEVIKPKPKKDMKKKKYKAKKPRKPQPVSAKTPAVTKNTKKTRKRPSTVKKYNAKPKNVQPPNISTKKVKTSIKGLKGEIRRLVRIQNSLINKRDELKLRVSLIKKDVKEYKK